jgi:hypothetical protein
MFHRPLVVGPFVAPGSDPHGSSLPLDGWVVAWPSLLPRLNGEWFDLSRDDVDACKSRGRFM